MNSTLKNIITLLVLFVFAFLGYYIFIQDGKLEVDGVGSDISEETLANTKLFIERRAILNQIKIDTSIFENKQFVSYRTFSSPIQPRPEGRTNPFDEFNRASDISINPSRF